MATLPLSALSKIASLDGLCIAYPEILRCEQYIYGQRDTRQEHHTTSPTLVLTTTPAMCIYAYHHYPRCGHISHFTATGCQEFTNQLRLIAGSAEAASCNDTQVTHDLLPSDHPDLCLQCEYEWSEAVLNNTSESLSTKQYRSIEGLDAKMSFIEIWARMTSDVRNEDASKPVPMFSNDDDEQGDVFFDISQELDGKYDCCHPLQLPQVPERPASMDHVDITKSDTSDDNSSLFYLNLASDTDDTSETVPLCMAQSPLECKDAGSFESGMRTRSKINLLDPLPSPRELYADLVKVLKETPPHSFLKNLSVVADVQSHADLSSQGELSDFADEDDLSGQSYATDNTLWRASMSDVSSIIFPPHTAYEWIPDLDLAGIAMARGLTDWPPVQGSQTFPTQSEDEDDDDSDGGCPLEDVSLS